MILFPIALVWLVVALVWIIRNSTNEPDVPGERSWQRYVPRRPRRPGGPGPTRAPSSRPPSRRSPGGNVEVGQQPKPPSH
jgi:hypothetical protein